MVHRGVCTLALMLLACGETSSGPQADASLDATRTPEMGAPDGGLDLGPDSSPGTVDAQTADVRDAAPALDLNANRSVTTCEEACGVYAECGRAGELFEDEGACLSQCARLLRVEAPTSWWQCLSFESCSRLQLCQTPRPEPLSCAEVCAAGATCGVEITDCEARCEAEGDAFRACGESVDYRCDPEGLLDCLGRDVFTACAHTCERGTQCNVLRPDGCLLDCVDGQYDPDPLFMYQANQRNACVRRSGLDCNAIDICVNPPAPGEEAPATVNGFCARWQACQLDEFIPCATFLDNFGGTPEFLNCVNAQVATVCPPEPFSLREACVDNGGGPVAGHCEDVCSAQRVCGLIDEGVEVQQACESTCFGAQNVLADDVERAQRQLNCVGSERCPQLRACLEAGSPETDCAVYCERLDTCGVIFPACLEVCDRDWARDRHEALRACVADAPDCDSAIQCAAPVPPPCQAFCERAIDCGQDQLVECEERCDDAHFADPSGALLFDACVISAPECSPSEIEPHGVLSCRARPEDALHCLGFCRATTECEGRRALGDCLQACRRGFVGEAGFQFIAAEGCLEDLDADASCDALTACVPDAVEADCPDFCEDVTRCGIDVPDCAVACAFDPLTRLHALTSRACRGTAECPAEPQAFFECVARPEDPTDSVIAAECTALCQARAFCGDLDAVDQVNCRRQCIGQTDPNDPDSFVRVAESLRCAFAGTCDALGDCLVSSAPSAQCAAHCDRLAECDGVEDAAVCELACARDFGRLRQIPWRACVVDAESCEDVEACSPPPGTECAAACDVLNECGVDPPRCSETCDDRHFADPVSETLRVACLLSANACAGPVGVLSCLAEAGPRAHACAGYCRGLGECDPDSELEQLECLEACVRGFSDENEPAFDWAEGCLLGLDADADCASILPCLQLH